MTTMLSLDLDGLRDVTFRYDEECDVASVFLGEPREAITEEAGDGWYIRETDGAISGLELHGFRERFLSEPFHAGVTAAVISELEEAAGRLLAQGIAITAPAEALPATARWFVLVLGEAAARFEHAHTAHP
ncbi:MAG: hypothetical protein IT302_11100 [Dehalococcoidia bacterium]|nr:hypothetical protein [Dehalococcoidia bacterium]